MRRLAWIPLLVLACSGAPGPGSTDLPGDALLPDDGFGSDVDVNVDVHVDVDVDVDAGLDAQAPDAADPSPGDASPEDAAPDSAPDAAPDSAPDAAPLPKNCCWTDADCRADQRCVGVAGDAAGACVRREWLTAFPSFPCWTDADCAGGLPCRHGDPPTCASPWWRQPGGCLAEGCCIVDDDCPEGQVCRGERCVAVPLPGQCRGVEDCDWGRQVCEGGGFCHCPTGGPTCMPCLETCDEVPFGTCRDLVDGGCCRGSDQCAGTAKEFCWYPAGAGPFPEWGVCAEKATKGRCWVDQQCLSGQVCEGAAACPCGADCGLPWEGPGLCVEALATCVATPAVASPPSCAGRTVRFDGTDCVECGGECGPFCDRTFPDLASCRDACHPDRRCEPWDGQCAEPAAGAWWAFDGTGCQPGSGCAVTGGAGVYDSAAACDDACRNATLSFDLKSSGGFAGDGFGTLSLEGRTLAYRPVAVGAAPCVRTLDAAAYRTVFEQVRAVDWRTVQPQYVPAGNPACCCDDFFYTLRVRFSGGGGPPVLAETRWCGQSFGRFGQPVALPPELLPLASWAVTTLGQEGQACVPAGAPP